MTDDAKYDLCAARDARWDGVFFVGVSTTGIYCRPICTARTPGRNRCTFYDSAGQAEAAGFRACFRCRPELAPGNAEVDAVDTLVAAAVARIDEGALNDAGVAELAAELGVSDRHLRRALEARLGVTPVDLAQTRRLALAKQLLQDTSLSLTEIAFAAGFGSVRRFNKVFQDVMGSPPSRLRKKHVEAGGPAALVMRLDYRAPYDFDGVLGFLAARAIPGVEEVKAGCYRRVVTIGNHVGTIAVARHKREALELRVSPSLVPVLMPLVARVRRLFDLDARPDVIGRVLGRDPVLARYVAAKPGLRVPGAVDGFAAAIRALLGQQVSVAAATTLAGRFAAAFGVAHDVDAALRVRFPTAKEVATRSVDAIAKIGLPGARAAAVHALANAVATGRVKLDGVRDLDAFVTSMCELPGIGPWTAHYLAMRALHLPDAFPAADLGVKKALAGATPRAAEARAEAWRPFRSYAVMYLWTSLGETHAEEENREVPDRIADARRERDGARRAAPAEQRRRTARGAERQVTDTRARRRADPRVLRG
jgi:AraC family transcriptional regulator, regulatory protein of adaptative response / DNA-3-methyladenine glycosylase II